MTSTPSESQLYSLTYLIHGFNLTHYYKSNTAYIWNDTNISHMHDGTVKQKHTCSKIKPRKNGIRQKHLKNKWIDIFVILLHLIADWLQDRLLTDLTKEMVENDT